MARDFDGSGDSISFGSDGTIDQYANLTVAFWMQWDSSAVQDLIVTKGDASTGLYTATHATTSTTLVVRTYTGVNGQWRGGTALGSGVRHIAWTHDGGLGAPTIYLDGVAESVTTLSTPTGTLDADNAHDLIVGGILTSDFDGRLQNFAYANAIWDAAQINRHRWWGRPGGAFGVLHPLFTDKLANEGNQTANGTATNTTVASLPRVMRPGCGGIW